MDSNDKLVSFAPESEEKESALTPWKVIIADDNREIHIITKSTLRKFSFDDRKLHFLSAYSGAEAMLLIAQHPDTALILLDVVMEDETAGMRVVQCIREQLNNFFVRIVLRTGQPGQAPEQKVIVDYDINDYKEKTELTANRLHTTLITSLRTYRDLMALEEAKRAVENASNAKTAFLATMSHELHTPLNAVLGYAELLIDDTMDEIDGHTDLTPAPERLKILNNIVSAGQSLNETLNDILDISLIETESVKSEQSSVDINPLIQNVIKKMTPLIEKNRNRVIFNACDVGVFLSDTKKIQRILYHLLNNATKFTQNGQIQLDISQEDGQWLRFSITDTGIGIRPEDLQRIFDMFTLVDSSSTRQVDGRGIGLTIVKYYTSYIGGEVTVESVFGEGSTFTVRMPLQRP